MKPYGTELRLIWTSEEYGPSSKYCKMKSKNRREWRRILHKMGRSAGRREMKGQLNDNFKKYPNRDGNTRYGTMG